MLHHVAAVVTDPAKPLLLIRSGREVPTGDFTVVEPETDQGLVLTRMVDNLEEVRARSESITQGGMGGGHQRP